MKTLSFAAALLALAGPALAHAQVDHQQHHPDAAPAQPQGQMPMGPMMQSMGGMMGNMMGGRPGMMGGGSGMMSCPMMGGMGSGMMGARGMGAGMMGGGGHMMKVMFAIADANGDGALSFEEVSAIHKRVFDRVDVNKDAKVSLDEIQTFMRD